MNKRWLIEDVHIDKNITEISNVIQKIMYKRGIRDKKEINKFLQGDLGDLYDPFLFRDMNRAVSRIEYAVKNRENVIIYGDYDVDGITSTALFYNYFLDNYGFEVDYYLPNRLKEGYGLNINALKEIAEDYDLLITVDCGITACKEINFAQEAGLDVIVTDHHQAAEKLPPALAILNPHISNAEYPCKYLAGVGVAFKVCQALNKNWRKYLDLVALGTIADIVPLKDENRILVKQGLEDIRNTDRIGLKLLLKKLGLADKPLTAGQIAYIIAPPLNAAGRIENPEKAIKLLTADTAAEAEPIAEELTEINRLRQQQEEVIFKQAVNMVKEKVDLSRDRCIILASEDWHPGIIGIVASRLVEKYYLPVILIALKDGEGRGSCRSINGVNIYELLKYCSDLLSEYGGHSQAAGLRVLKENIAEFRDKFNNYLRENFNDIDFVPVIKIDSVIEEKDISRDLYDNINQLMPFGAGNPRPKFLISNTEVKKSYAVGKENRHLKFSLKDGINGIGFDLGCFKDLLTGRKLDLAFNIKLNKWRGKEEVQLNLLDVNLRSSAEAYPVSYSSSGINIYDKRGCKEPLKYIRKILNHQTRIGIYINSRKKGREFEKHFAGENIYYFSSTNLLPDIIVDELLLISLPFSLAELNKMFRLFPEGKIKLHLLYGQDQYYTGCKLIKNQLPTGNFLKKLYKKIKFKEYKNFASRYNKKLVNSGLNILADMELIDFKEDEIKLLNTEINKLDFSKSMRYNEITDIIDQFNKFSQLAYTNNLFKLMRVVKNKQEVNNGF